MTTKNWKAKYTMKVLMQDFRPLKFDNSVFELHWFIRGMIIQFIMPALIFATLFTVAFLLLKIIFG